MLLIAQRVVSRQGKQGVNAYCYLHGDRLWLGDPPEDLGEPQLANKSETVGPPGNQVRSYLDILAPDVTPTAQILRDVLDTSELASDTRPLPWRFISGDTSFTFDAVYELAMGWQEEIAELLERALAVRTTP